MSEGAFNPMPAARLLYHVHMPVNAHEAAKFSSKDLTRHGQMEREMS
jgi:hypothetical protein